MKKIKKLKKEKSPTWYRKKLVDRAKKVAKERDGWTCQYCGKSKVQGWAIHGSHILPEGAYIQMSVEPYNIIALCATCHVGGFNRGGTRVKSWHGDPMHFSEWFNLKWPGRYQELRTMAEEKKKHVVNWKLQYESLHPSE